MAYTLPLPHGLAQQGWKVKIRTRERNEPPHATILCRTRAWRYGLRELAFLDREPPPRDVPDEVVAAIRRGLEQLKSTWNAMYPQNPITSRERVCDD
jgi:hypothetical protein